MTEKTDSAEPRLSHARDYTRPGFYAKLVLMALIKYTQSGSISMM